MTDEHTAAIDFQSRQPKGLDLAHRTQEAQAVCDAFLAAVKEKREEYDHVCHQYQAAYTRLRELRAMADRGQR